MSLTVKSAVAEDEPAVGMELDLGADVRPVETGGQGRNGLAWRERAARRVAGMDGDGAREFVDHVKKTPVSGEFAMSRPVAGHRDARRRIAVRDRLRGA